MKLHVVRASHNCRRVLATADHLGLDLEIVEINIGAGEHKSPDYLNLNSNGKVPTLELDDDQGTLWESNAIMQYLASLAPKSDFYPSDALSRANVTRWQLWEANHLSTGTGPLAFERLFKPMFLKQTPNEEAVEKALKQFHTFAPVLDAHLARQPYLLGETLSLADFSVGAAFTYSVAAQAPVDEYPHIKAWLARLDAVPAWKASAPS